MKKTGLSKLLFINFFCMYIISAFAPICRASTPPTLQNLTQNDVDDTFKFFGALLNFRPYEPASSFAKYFGLSVGVGANATKTSNLKFISNYNQIPSYLGSAYATFIVQAPLGLSLELGVLPHTKVSQFSFEQYAANLKWTINEVLLRDWLPFDIALRFGAVSNKIIYTQDVSGLSDMVSLSQKLWNSNVLISKKLSIFEPYIGGGAVYQTALIENSNPSVRLISSLINPAFGNGIDFHTTTPVVFAGVQIHMWKFNVTLQDDYQFGLNNFGAKIALKF